MAINRWAIAALLGMALFATGSAYGCDNPVPVDGWFWVPVSGVDNQGESYDGGHWQWGTLYYVCYSGGGTSGGGNGSSGGGTPPDPPPPDVSIISISDQNPGQPILAIQPNDAVVETQVAYNGVVAMTTGRTDHVFLQALSVFETGATVSIQCRNSANVYATAIMHIQRSFIGPFRGTASVYAVWTKLNLSDEPIQYHGDWTRTVDLAVTETTYDVGTVGARNGRYEHNLVEDQLGGASADTPIPAWEARYRITNPQQANVYYGWSCSLWPKDSNGFGHTSICTEPDAFSSDGSPGGSAEIVDMDIPYQASTVTIYTGSVVNVSP